MFKGPNLTFTIAGLLIIALGIILRLLFRGVSGFLDALPDTVLNVGVSILAISVIEAIWRQLGSDPLTKGLDEIRKSFDLFGDSRETGLIRVHMGRQTFEQARMKQLLERVKVAHRIDLMGRALNRSVTNNVEFLKFIRERVASGDCYLRVLIPDPQGPACIQRDEQEARLKQRATGQVINDTIGSIQRLLDLRAELPVDAQKRFELKLIKDIQLFANTFRVDDYIWIQPYLYHARGGQSPQIEAEGEQSPLFQRYHEEFEVIWKEAHDPPTTT